MGAKSVLSNLPKKEAPFWSEELKGIDYADMAKKFELERQQIGRLTGVSTHSVRYDKPKMPKEVKDFFNCIHQTFTQVFLHFDRDFDKAKLWFELPNPMLGRYISPRDMIYIGRHKKLLQIVLDSVEGRRP